jgi:hypothetical protein
MIMGGHKLTQEGCLVMSMEVLGAAAGVLHQPPPMYVFGDSYLDVGMNNYLPGTSVPRANKPYYGVDFQGFPTGRFSNGRNTADYIGISTPKKRVRATLHPWFCPLGVLPGRTTA